MDEQLLTERDQIGRETRARRRAAGLSIAEVARRAEVSAAFISQLESGRTSVSIPTLYRIAAALGCSANVLLGPSGTARHVVRNGTGERMHVASGSGSPHGRRLSRSGPAVLMEAWHYVMQPDDEPQDWFAHPGEDFVYVVHGTIVIEFEDGSKIKLGSGDSLHHDGALAHRWVLAGAMPAEAVVAVAVPPGRELRGGEFTHS